MLFESIIIDILKSLPSNQLLQAKKQVRELLAQKRRLLKKEDIAEQSNKLIGLLEQLPCFQSAKTILLYYPTHNEVDLLPLVKRYKREKMLLFPVVHRRHTMTACPYEGNDQMHRGKFNIPEPTTDPYTGKIDLILLPGVAFDLKGNRLGRGGGYYDRYLAQLDKDTLLVGVGYDFQLIEEVPSGKYDKKMDYVITPTAGVMKIKKD